MYKQTNWIDEVKDEHSGEIIQEGTLQSAGHFNNMEQGITDVSVAATLLLIASGLSKQQTSVERHELTFNNSASYPFNNSQKTISLTTTRNSTDYTVEVDVLSHSGNVGDWVVYDKQLNGFKIKFDGSAKSVTAVVKVQGGM